MKAVFSAVVAVVLLGIYVYLVVEGLSVAQCVSEGTCEASGFSDRMASSLTLIAGLVSALVIAELAITKPGEPPAARLMSSEASKDSKSKKLLQIVTGLYLLVWLGAGLAAFTGGYLALEPGDLPPLSDLGQGWLGIAVGAGYAYFGIDK